LLAQRSGGKIKIGRTTDFCCTGWDEGEQLFAPKRQNLIRQKKSVVHPSKSERLTKAGLS
jgi:hypothetical protein